MWLFVLPLLVVIADQFSKYIVVATSSTVRGRAW